MKRIILTVFTIMVVSYSFSQIKVRPGIRTGLNLSKITNSENVSRKAGVNAAVFINFHFTPFYELQPEFTYSNQGWSRDGFNYYDPFNDNTFFAESQDISSHYIGATMINKFKMSPKLGLHILFGPGLEFNVSDNLQYDDLTPVDLVFIGGIGYEFPIGLGIEARYKQGIIDVDESYYDYYDNGYYEDDYYNGKNKLNSVFQFNVYYKFGW
jgi:hypothetical protein